MKKILLALAILTLLMYSCEKENTIQPSLNDSEIVTSAPDDVIAGQYIVILKGDVTALKSALSTESRRKHPAYFPGPILVKQNLMEFMDLHSGAFLFLSMSKRPLL